MNNSTVNLPAAVEIGKFVAGNGQMNVADAFDMENPVARAVAAKAIKETEEIRKYMSAPEVLKLPALLEKRRQEYGITDGAFARRAVYDRIYVHQIPMFEGNTFGNTQIFMPDTSKVKEREQAARGIIVSAGALALDHLRSNGMDLGHIVNFARLAPYRIPCDSIAGKERYVMVLRDGDVIGSEDLEQQLRSGEIELLGERQPDGSIQHVYRYHDTERPYPGAPTQPWIAEDY